MAVNGNRRANRLIDPVRVKIGRFTGSLFLLVVLGPGSPILARGRVTARKVHRLYLPLVNLVARAVVTGDNAHIWVIHVCITVENITAYPVAAGDLDGHVTAIVTLFWGGQIGNCALQGWHLIIVLCVFAQR